jgi:hypothetical protein
MNKYLAHILAFSAAATAPAAVTLFFDWRFAAAMALYGLTNVLFIAVPVYLVACRRRHMSLPICITGGFIAAALPAAFLFFPFYDPSSGASSVTNGVVTLQNGVPTAQGWLRYLYGLSSFGVIGALCATVFWVVLRVALGSNNSFKADALRARP